MPYRVELYYMSGSSTNTLTLYDGEGAWDISVSTGGNNVGELRFCMRGDVTAATYVKNSTLRYERQISVIHSKGTLNTETRLFTGFVTSYEIDIDNVMTVTCKDELFALENVHMRLVTGLEDKRMTLFAIGVAAMEAYNASPYPAFTITAIREVYGFTGYSESYKTITGSTSASNLLHNVSRDVTAREVMTCLDAFRLVAEGVSGVMRMEYVSMNERILVISHATESARAHTYSYGEDLLSCTVRYDTEEYYNAVYPSGGLDMELDVGTANSGKLVYPAKDGDSLLVIKALTSSVVTVGSGDVVRYGPGSTLHTIRSPKETDYSSSDYARVTVDPPVQDYGAAEESCVIYRDATTNDSVVAVASSAIGNITPDGNRAAAHGDGSVYLADTPTLYRIRKEGLLSDSGIVSNNKLLRVSLARLDEYVTENMLSRNVDASFVGKELSGSQAAGESSHTYVGEIVHITHTAIGVDDDMRVDAMSFTVGEPSSYSYTVGRPRKTITDKVRQLGRGRQ